ncbi:hypothetical protein E4T44_12990, partial [Aureobasidium sp. EXF-8845]
YKVCSSGYDWLSVSPFGAALWCWHSGCRREAWMVRLRMWVTGTECGRESWSITRVRQSKLLLNTVMVMVMVVSKVMVVEHTSLLLPRSSGLSEEMDAIRVYHNSILGVLRLGHINFTKHHTVFGMWYTGDFSIVVSVEDQL